MATIKALEGRTVHQIQSGQVIVDLCSVVKELIENSLDAEATSIEVRFKNHGLDSVEVQDNGVGISSENYETIALKHYTSKLSSYDELTSLQTFGFRGEALSSLCALSNFHILTARSDEAPKGTRLDFEVSGQLKGTQVVAGQKGTTVVVENLFMNLPVRRRELEKNIKREYGKVLGILQAYACISNTARISVSNLMAKGKKVVVFATKPNSTARENIANVYGAKIMPSLVPMNLNFEMQSSPRAIPGLGTPADPEDKKVHVVGHVSRPIFGEGRQTPDRQMFFVNSRPCGLPQVAKVFNEVYKSYNISQSPFICANIILNTNAYDVNVSPDKRTILLHDQNALLDSLKQSLTDLFENQDQTVPQSSKVAQKLPYFRPLSISREVSAEQHEPPAKDRHDPTDDATDSGDLGILSKGIEKIQDREPDIIENLLAQDSRDRIAKPVNRGGQNAGRLPENKGELVDVFEAGDGGKIDFIQTMDSNEEEEDEDRDVSLALDSRVKSTPTHIAEHQQAGRNLESKPSHPKSPSPSSSEPEKIPAIQQKQPQISFGPTSGTIINAFSRIRPRRNTQEVATITIGSKTTTAVIGSPFAKRRRISESPVTARPKTPDSLTQKFGSSMRAFAAPGAKITEPASKSRQRSSDIAQPYTRNYQSSGEVSDATASEDGDEAQETPNGSIRGPEDEGNGLSDPSTSNGEASDDEYLDEKDKKTKEDAKVAELIHQAEVKLATPSVDNFKRANEILVSGMKCSTTQWTQVVQTSEDQIAQQMQSLEKVPVLEIGNLPQPGVTSEVASPEERLSLTVSKEDFSKMHIIGQFNLGFILAMRPGQPQNSTFGGSDDELFIIDQHASDEKYNFERLQSSTVVQHQRLVQPRALELTAIEEEIILENNNILIKNGFEVSIDTTGDHPVGRRCKLLSLPMSREVTFNITDLEELLAILADSPHLIHHPSPSSVPSNPDPNANPARSIPRPSKVRRMFAMRACRSSTMIGKSLSRRQMERLVTHMGEIDKPWNCPHGRPTMRHVLSLGGWEGWREGRGLVGMGEEEREVDWRGFLDRMGGRGVEEEDSEEGEDENEEDGEDENYHEESENSIE